MLNLKKVSILLAQDWIMTKATWQEKRDTVELHNSVGGPWVCRILISLFFFSWIECKEQLWGKSIFHFMAQQSLSLILRPVYNKDKNSSLDWLMFFGSREMGGVLGVNISQSCYPVSLSPSSFCFPVLIHMGVISAVNQHLKTLRHNNNYF